jgi:anti-sigma factor RsiW
MSQPCPDMQDRILDYVLTRLDPQQSEIVREHLTGCDACRQYVQSLRGQVRSLIALGSEIDAGMAARQGRVIEALHGLAPTQESTTRVFPFLGGFLRTAVAAVLVLGVGIGLGRWTAPRVNVEQLRADLQASLAASVTEAVQESILSQVDQRLQAGLSKNEAGLRAELANQVRDDVQRFTAQAASNSETLVEKRFDELVQLVEEARLKDRQHMVKALEQVERNRYRDRSQIQTGLAALIEKKPATVQQ